MRGAIDYIVIGFESNHFDGEIIRELDKASKAGVIEVLGLTLVTRGDDGTVAAVSVTDPALADIIQDFNIDSGLLDEADIEEVGELLEDGTSAGLLIVEHVWSRGLKQAIINAKGTLILDGRIHPDASKDLDTKEGA